MADKEVNIVVRIKDAATAEINKIKTAVSGMGTAMGASMSGVAGPVNNAKNAIGGMGTQAGGVFSGMKVGWASFVTGFNQGIGIITTAWNSYKNIATAKLKYDIPWEKLDISIKAFGESISKIKPKVEEFAKSANKKFGYSAGEMAGVMTNLARATGSWNDALKLGQEALVVMAVNGGDAANAASVIGKAYAGSTMQLIRMFPFLKEYKKQLEDQAKAQGKTITEHQKGVLMLREMMRQVGGLADKASESEKALRDYERAVAKIRIMIANMLPDLKKAIDSISGFVKFIVDNAVYIKDALMVMFAFKGTAMVIKGIMGIRAAIVAVTVATTAGSVAAGGLGAAFSGGFFPFIIAGFAAAGIEVWRLVDAIHGAIDAQRDLNTVMEQAKVPEEHLAKIAAKGEKSLPELRKEAARIKEERWATTDPEKQAKLDKEFYEVRLKIVNIERGIVQSKKKEYENQIYKVENQERPGEVTEEEKANLPLVKEKLKRINKELDSILKDTKTIQEQLAAPQTKAAKQQISAKEYVTAFQKRIESEKTEYAAATGKEMPEARQLHEAELALKEAKKLTKDKEILMPLIKIIGDLKIAINSSIKEIKPDVAALNKMISEVQAAEKKYHVVLLEHYKRAAEVYNIPLNYLLAVSKAESRYNPKAKSPKGAMGLMQLMPGTAAGLGVTKPWDIEQNIMGGAKYLRQMLDLSQVGGNPELALRAYNAGPAAIKRSFKFKETNAYVAKITGLMGSSLTATAGGGGGGAISGKSIYDVESEYAEQEAKDAEEAAKKAEKIAEDQFKERQKKKLDLWARADRISEQMKSERARKRAMSAKEEEIYTEQLGGPFAVARLQVQRTYKTDIKEKINRDAAEMKRAAALKLIADEENKANEMERQARDADQEKSLQQQRAELELNTQMDNLLYNRVGIQAEATQYEMNKQILSEGLTKNLSEQMRIMQQQVSFEGKIADTYGIARDQVEAMIPMLKNISDADLKRLEVNQEINKTYAELQKDMALHRAMPGLEKDYSYAQQQYEFYKRVAYKRGSNSDYQKAMYFQSQVEAENKQKQAFEDAKAAIQSIHEELRSSLSDSIVEAFNEGGKKGVDTFLQYLKTRVERDLADALANALTGKGAGTGGLLGGLFGGGIKTKGGEAGTALEMISTMTAMSGGKSTAGLSALAMQSPPQLGGVNSRGQAIGYAGAFAMQSPGFTFGGGAANAVPAAGGISKIGGAAGFLGKASPYIAAALLIASFFEKGKGAPLSGVAALPQFAASNFMGGSLDVLRGSKAFERAAFSHRNIGGALTSEMAGERIGGPQEIRVTVNPSPEFDVKVQGKLSNGIKLSSTSGVPRRTGFTHG